MSKDENHWHLDKRVPIALLLMLLFQSGGAVWWAATTSGRLAANEKAIAEIVKVNAKVTLQVSSLKDSRGGRLERIARVEEALKNMAKQVGNLVNRIDQLLLLKAEGK